MRSLVFLLLMLLLPSAMAAELRELRVWDGPESTRVVFDLSAAAEHKMFTLANPDRVVIDIAGLSKASAAIVARAQAKGLVRKLRAGPRDDGSMRVVLDVGSGVTPKSFDMTPNEQYGNRLIVELYGRTPTLEEISGGAKINESASAESSAAVAAFSNPASMSTTPAATAKVEQAAVAVTKAPPGLPVRSKLPPAGDIQLAPSINFVEKPIVIAVDAGHGGEDPGAIGRGGLQEKNASLAMARRLANLINQQPGMKAVLTRDGDYFIDLRERTVRARKAQADMFVSIHCNAYKDRNLRGSAVYVLSDRGATNEQARWLAHKENSADLVGGLDLGAKDNELAAVLIDLSQASSMEASFDVGGRVLQSLAKVNPLQKPVVQQAGFMVLKSPDIPSLLVETAFITNDQDEKLLGSPAYHDQIARSVLEGIQGYFKSYRPHQQQPQIAEEKPRLQKVASNKRSARSKPQVD
ncbi:N-acetylmuramoyl-L-alanine amidase [Hydrocarboniphaga sp.]|uniref:N-acetylmuramoyl-L-alanine amidase n=1 Tax=Hydrocarboniphaga sp. TaxID=2033016 RepID=UPI003D134B19